MGQHCLDCPARKGAVTNLTPARGTKAAHFANRVMRKVIVEQEAAFHFTLLQVIHELLVFLGAERGSYQRLRFTACKQSRTVNTWQPADFAAYRTNFRGD